MSARKRTAVLIAATAAATAVSLALAGPASASDAIAKSVAASGYVAGACDIVFEDYGDHFWVNDDASDGAGCWGDFTVNGSLWGDNWYLENHSGVGTAVDYNFNFPEGAKVVFRACVMDNGTIYNRTCSAEKTAYA